MTHMNRTALATRIIHAHNLKIGSPQGIHDASTMGREELVAQHGISEDGALDSCYGSSLAITGLEATLAGLEDAEVALVFCSGMVAETALILAHGQEGVICIGNAYEGTLELLGNRLPELGVTTNFLLGSELSALEGLLASGSRLVFMETPTDPTMEVLDIQSIANIARAHDALVVVDSTFASPVNQQPLHLGADIVMHGATKYLGGHADVAAGVLMGSREILMPVAKWRRSLGCVLDLGTAARLADGLRTLVTRVKQQNATAQAIAEAMLWNPNVDEVFYPGLPESSGHGLAARQMQGFGGMLSIEVQGGGQAATRAAGRLQLFGLAPNLGGVESLVAQPSYMTHHGLPPGERARRGLRDGLLRLSVGLEDPDDLILDLEQALS